MLAGPSSQLPYRTIERIFLTSCLLANLIFAGTFQVINLAKYNRTCIQNKKKKQKLSSCTGFVDNLIQYGVSLQRHRHTRGIR